MARAGCSSWGLLRRPGSHQGRQDGKQRSSVPSLIEGKRRYRRRPNAAVPRVPRAKTRHPHQDPGNHARWPHRRTRSGASAPCGWPGLSIPVFARPYPLPARSGGPGWPAPPQQSTVPFLFKNVWNTRPGSKCETSRKCETLKWLQFQSKKWIQG